MVRTLNVAVTGPTGTIGFGLVPLLEADARIGRVGDIAGRQFDRSARAWAQMARPPGAYNIAGDGVLTGADVARQLGVVAMPLPNQLVQAKRALGWKPRYSGREVLRD